MKNLDTRKIAIIGAGGFIGTNICRRLADRTCSINAFGRSKSFPQAITDINWISGDFNSPSDLALAVEGCIL